jgi:hypothetical protein
MKPNNNPPVASSSPSIKSQDSHPTPKSPKQKSKSAQGSAPAADTSQNSQAAPSK